MYKDKLKKIDENVYELPITGKMLVPGRLFLSERLIESLDEEALKQVANVAMLPGIQKYSIGLSDMHSGYGFSIGGVAAFSLDEGIISPGGVGFDINCGVRLLVTNLYDKDIEKKKKEIIHSLFRSVPSGVGRGGKLKLSHEELKEVLKKGAEWAVEKGYGNKNDLENCEENGKMKSAVPENVSPRALARGKDQLGTIGAGNHFVEVQKVEHLFDKKIAEKFNLSEGQIVIMIHTGSRGLGHQVASDYIKLMENEYPEEVSKLEDRNLIYAPIKSKLGDKYYGAMCAAANFAFCNRQIISHWIREAMKHIFPKFKAEVLYDVTHNMAKMEKHTIFIDGKNSKGAEVCVHRKGATRSFGPSRRAELPKKFSETGQPVIIPGSMGTASYVLVGTDKAEELSFSSTAHGAGRAMSRTQAKKDYTGEQIKKQLNDKGIEIEAGSLKGIAEEAPQAYKDVDEVVSVSDKVGIGKLVVRLVPLAVMKG